MKEPLHPTKWIKGNKSSSLSGKVVVLAVTGSIGAVRVIELARELIRNGAEVYGVMSQAACNIIHPDALHYATGNPVITKITGQVEHVKFCGLKGSADLLLVAPATANTIGKIANGIDDTTVTTFATTAIGSGIPVMVVPAMHNAMYEHPAVIDNMNRLKDMGISFTGPHFSEGIAKIASNEQIVLEVEHILANGPLCQKKVIITSGATAEAIDPIRILTNRSSGNTGRQIAMEMYRRGAYVTIVHRGHLGMPGINEIFVESASDMTGAVLEELEQGYDLLISAAAISDYTLEPESNKIRSGGELKLSFRSTRKLISEVRAAYPDIRIIGFKAEAGVSRDELLERARSSIESNGLCMVVANDVSENGMGTPDNDVCIINGKNGNITYVTGSKRLIASSLADEVELLFDGENTDA